jgi:hypothetical protein
MKSITNTFSSCDTLFDAKCLYGATFDYSSNLYDLHRVIGKNLKWKGKLVEDSTFTTAYDKDVDLKQFTKGRTSKYRSVDKHVINCEKDVVVVLNDMARPNGTLGRVLNMILKEDKKVYLIRYKTQEAEKKFIKDTGFDGELLKLSELPKNKLTEFSEWGYGRNSYSGGSGDSNPKSNKKIFKFSGWDEPRYALQDRNQSQHWEVCDELPSEGLYVELDAFQSRNVASKDIHSLHRAHNLVYFIDKLKSLDESVDVDIYGVKSKDEKTLANLKKDSNWINFYDWAKSEAKELIKSNDLSQKVVDRAAVAKLDCAIDITRDEIKIEDFIKELVAEDSFAGEYFQAQVEMLRDSEGKVIDKAKEAANAFELTLEDDLSPTHDLERMKSKFLKKYAMLNHVDGWRFKYHFKKDNDSWKDTLNYINVIDMCDISRKR